LAISALDVFALSKNYTDETVIGGGAIKGKNCTIDSITDITGGHRVTFKWTLDDGTEKTTTMDVLDGQEGPQGADGADGEDGVGIASITFKETDSQGNNVYTITLTNGDSDDITCPRGPQGPTCEVDSAISSTSTNPVQNKVIYGALQGKADLDNGKIPANQLPSYVDDVKSGYLYEGQFYEDAQHTTVITAEADKIYIELTSNKTYRWSGSAYVEISESLALGETSATAYRGDRGKAAYDTSLTVGNVANLTTTEKSSVVGAINEVNASKVTPNPVTTATDTLTKLQVGSTVYGISGGSGASAFSDLTDVSITSPTDGQVPVYNSTTEKWENGSIASGGGHTIIDGEGTSLTQRSNLQFSGYLKAEDDSTNLTTVVSDDYTEITWANYQALTDAQRANNKYIILDYPSNSYTEVSGVLTAGSTSITLYSSAITTSSVLLLDYYTSVYGLSPLTSSVSNGSITLTFAEQSSDVTVAVRIGLDEKAYAYEYSNSEQIIGTWIDGNPIYRLVVPYESTGSVGKSYLISTITSGLKVITLDGIVEESNSVVNINNYNCRILYNKGTGTLTFQGDTSWGQIKGQVILTYTKPSV